MLKVIQPVKAGRRSCQNSQSHKTRSRANSGKPSLNTAFRLSRHGPSSLNEIAEKRHYSSGSLTIVLLQRETKFRVRTMLERTESNLAPKYLCHRQVRDCHCGVRCRDPATESCFCKRAISIHLIRPVTNRNEQSALQYSLCPLKVP